MSMPVIVAVLLAIPTGGCAKNPFQHQQFYVNPSKEFESSIATASGEVKVNLGRMQKVPSAYWIDQKAKIRGEDTTSVEGILKDASSKSPPELVVFMWYDLPNRDCDAKASNGEICCKKNDDGTCDYLAPGDCADGIDEYKSGYVDPFVSVLKEFEGKLQVVLVMEPDGLANLATNIADPHCGNMATQTAYTQGVKYAVEQLSTQAPSVAIYLDAAHGGWLGWENNLEEFMKMLKGMALPVEHIRGFATNVANYQALGIQCPWCPDQGFRNGFCMNHKHQGHPCCRDPCDLLGQWNFGNNELNYAAGLVAAANAVLGMEAHVIIDTGRNGVVDQRQDCANWCNPRGAGAGVPSTTQTANTSLVDAYFWLKTPGESDGCSQTLPGGQKCPRFDSKCASVDSLGTKAGEPHAPEAGQWFDYQVKQLAENAHFAPPEAADSDTFCHSSSQPVSSIMLLPSPASAAHAANNIANASAAQGACAAAYQQCGGQSWSGPTCCEAGCKCSPSGDYYSRCTPLRVGGKCGAADIGAQAPLPASPSTSATAVVPTQTPAAPAAAVPTQATAAPPFVPAAGPSPRTPTALQPPHTPLGANALAGRCAATYGQCGGKGWTGPTCCDGYCSCQFVDASRSECVPMFGAGAHGPAHSNVAVVLRKDDERFGLLEATGKRSNSVWPAAPLTSVFAALALLGLLVVRTRCARPEARHEGAEGEGLTQSFRRCAPEQVQASEDLESA